MFAQGIVEEDRFCCSYLWSITLSFQKLVTPTCPPLGVSLTPALLPV